ncbi:hypothetical protein ACI2JA_01665 [Alkalihalobacillus sp. NPDC078783]
MINGSLVRVIWMMRLYGYILPKEWLVSNGYEVRLLFMVWCQGETDAFMSGDIYVPKLTNMIEEMCARGGALLYDPNWKQGGDGPL